LRAGYDARDVGILAAASSRCAGPLTLRLEPARRLLLLLFLTSAFTGPFVLCRSGFLHGASQSGVAKALAPANAGSDGRFGWNRIGKVHATVVTALL
jgi:hypothetical protein